jgi:hypothetical protein
MAATVLGFLILGWGIMGVDSTVFIFKTFEKQHGTAPPFSDQRERLVLAGKLLSAPLALMICGAASVLWGFFSG